MNARRSDDAPKGRTSFSSSVFMYMVLPIFIISAVILLCYCTAEISDANPGDQFESDNVYYTVVSEPSAPNPGSVAIYGCNTLNITDSLVIPDSVEYPVDSGKIYNVTSIKDNAFDRCILLKYLTVGKNVTSIGASSFAGCTALLTVDLGDGVVTVGNNAFNGCYSMTNLRVGNSVLSLGESSFSNCTSLRIVRLGNSLNSIGNFAFNGCYHLVEICNDSAMAISRTTSSALTDGGVAIYAVHIYKSLKDTSIIKSIDLASSGKGYYYSRDDIGTSLVAIDNPGSSIVLPNTLSDRAYTIHDYAFCNDTRIVTVTFGTGVTEIGEQAFASCTSLTTISLNNGLKSIGYSAFRGCASLTSIIIPDSVTEIGGYSFNSCISLTSVSLNDKIGIIADYTFAECISLNSFTFTEAIFYYGEGAFKNCYSLSYLSLGSKVSDISNSAFSGCTSLKGSSSNVRIQVSATKVPNLGNDAFPSGSYITVPDEKVDEYKTKWSGYNIVSDKFNVVFMNGSVEFFAYKSYYGEKVILPSTQPQKESTDKCDYRFKSWSGYTEGMTVTGDMTFYAEYDEIPKDQPSSGNNNTVLIIVIAVIAVLAVIAIAVIIMKRKGGQN